MYGAKAQIATQEKGIPVHVVTVPFTQERGYEPKHPEVLRINPKRQVPVLPAARAHARLLELKSDEVFFPHVIRLMSLQDRLGEPPAQEAIFHLHRLYAEWESTLGSRDYLSESYSYADIAFFIPGLLAWRTRVVSRAAVRPVVAQYVETLRSLNLAVPQFMTEIVANHGNSTHR
jgi:glutathione S-transferase